MAQIICLANSRKNANRCIAGMTPDGVWIRPVSTLRDGAITWKMRQIDGEEPELLDLLSIPMAKTGPDYGHQPENRLLLKGPWTRVGKVKVSQVAKICEKRNMLLHTASDCVPVRIIMELDPSSRYSLQLIRVKNAEFFTRTSFRGIPQHRALFTYEGNKYSIVITDPLAEERIANNENLSPDCVLAVSMGGPYPDGNYYKFIAAVIEM